MTTLVICNCGRVQEYDEDLSLTCQHCDDELFLPECIKGEDEYEI